MNMGSVLLTEKCTRCPKPTRRFAYKASNGRQTVHDYGVATTLPLRLGKYAEATRSLASDDNRKE